MKLSIPTDIFYRVLFVICIVVPYFYNYELTFVIWSFAVAVTISKMYSVSIIKQVSCFVAIMLIAGVSAFFYDHKLYFIIRDIAYMLKPILGLLLGYQLYKKINTGVFRLIVVTGVFLALLHFGKLAYAVVIKHAFTVNDIRGYAGFFSDFEVYSLVILMFHKRFGLNYSKKKVILYFVILSASVFLYMARTNYIQFFIIYLAVQGYFQMNRRSIIAFSTVILAAIIGYSAVLYINPKRNGQGIEALLYKIKIAPMEPFQTHINKADWKELHDNYRSYENILTLRQVPGEGTGAILFGKGLGSTIDLKLKIWLGDKWMRYISILHNGFMTVFLKSGLLGILFFLYSIYLLFKQKRVNNHTIQQLNYLMIGTGIFMVLSSWVFMGLYFTADTKSIIIGFLICYREALVKQVLGDPEKQIIPV